MWVSESFPQIIAQATAQRWPVAGTTPRATRDGALLAYGPDRDALQRRSASCVDRILEGARPGDLPIEQPTTFELVLNLKTARALGITVPRSMMARATEVIERTRARAEAPALQTPAEWRPWTPTCPHRRPRNARRWTASAPC